MELRTPELEFGDNKGYFTDPREGLASAGPFSLRFGRAHKAQIRLGLVGPRDLLEDARQWYRRCENTVLTGKPTNPMYLDFQGFERVFQSVVVLDKTWEIDIQNALDKALERSGRDRFEGVLNAYSTGISRLSRTQSLDVITCCLPDAVVASCWSLTRRLTRIERKQLERARKDEESGQLSFDAIWAPDDTAEELLQRDFRRALKARAMDANMPIQIATSSLFCDDEASQDPATRAWNSSVALFYKAGGIPWRVRSDGPATCFVGISFHYLRTTKSDLMYSSVAQAFSSEGEGFALKGDSVPRSRESGHTAYLTLEQASKLARKILDEYRERTGKEPSRLVLHKTTQFTADERRGFSEVFNQIPVVEFMNVAPSDFRLVQRSAYPPKRGTLCRINDDATYLFTTGYIPEWQTYPGMHVPVPLKIVTDRETDIVRAASDVLALARMNWNTAFDTTGAPITLRFARQVGGIMAEVGQKEPSPSYRFYM
ncbi:MAG: hypothetical protein LLG20_16035 [Acidobacteriales bacterium]|nr:hypothetical protein [Terriglobales bacterium]